jgi:hypothetical protein
MLGRIIAMIAVNFLGWRKPEAEKTLPDSGNHEITANSHDAIAFQAKKAV